LDHHSAISVINQAAKFSFVSLQQTTFINITKKQLPPFTVLSSLFYSQRLKQLLTKNTATPKKNTRYLCQIKAS
ncbi:MAG: hypothetical protein K2P84_09425, partial [Undibacterium sp.]|nr:hypothetical protein [Undibacterium sp.]